MLYVHLRSNQTRWSKISPSVFKTELCYQELPLKYEKCTMAHNGHAANKKRSLQTKKMRCKQKTIAANKKDALQTKNDRCKQKRCAAYKKRSLQTKKMHCKQKTIAANKKDALQTKNAVTIWPVTGQGFQNTKWPAVRYFQ